MKRILFIALLLCGCPVGMQAQRDSSDVTHYVTRSMSVGGGFSNVLDSYLSPLEYKGGGTRLLFENMRMTHLMGDNVSAQHVLQINASYTHNPTQTAHIYAGLVNYSYALHYRFRPHDRLKLLVGPMLSLNAGAIYNRRNSNNPAQAKAYGGLGVSGMAIYRFRVFSYPFTVRYQANIPLAGIMFSPEYGESYYEIFSLRHGGNNVVFTSLHNHPSIRQWVTLDIPIWRSILRLGYVYDIQQAKVNHLKSHIYSHDFTIGFVRTLYLPGQANHSDISKATPF